MKMKLLKTIVCILVLFVVSGVNVQAKWWIFGQSRDEVAIRYLYLNKMAFDESTMKISVYRDSLQDGMIHIRGKARVSTGKIADVRITLDDKKTWVKSKLSDDGAFSYDFVPEAGKTYVIYIEVMDTRGKTNDVESTRKEVTLSEENMTGAVKAALDAMVEAYIQENPHAFMAYVSEGFVGDKNILDRAVRLDFSAFDNIDMRITPGTIAVDSGGKIFVSLNYNRMVISTKTGAAFRDKGTTEFVFEVGEKHPVVYSMKNPLIFGLSLAEEVSTGTVIGIGDEPILILDDQGNVDAKPLSELMDGGSDSGDAVESGNNISLVYTYGPPMGFAFAEGSVQDFTGDFVVTGGDSNYGYAWLQNGALIRDMGAVSLNDVSEAPASGYADTDVVGVNLYEGHTYAFQMPGPRYGLLHVRTVNVEVMNVYMILDYKYRADGLRSF
jgi:hypothetical protein